MIYSTTTCFKTYFTGFKKLTLRNSYDSCLERIFSNMPANAEESSKARPELFFALVGAVGSDVEMVSGLLLQALNDVSYAAHPVRLSDLLEREFEEKADLNSLDRYSRYKARMKAGTEYRERKNAGDAVAILGIHHIMAFRRQVEIATIGEDNLSTDDSSNLPSRPVSNTAYIIHQLKHPAEVKTLRETYGDSFFLIGCYAPRETRIQTLASRIAQSRFTFQSEPFRKEAEELAEIDRAEEGTPFGQKVQETFPLSDVFVNCAEPKVARNQIRRFVELIFGNPFHSPSYTECAMFHAKAASLRSRFRKAGWCYLLYQNG